MLYVERLHDWVNKSRMNGRGRKEGCTCWSNAIPSKNFRHNSIDIG